MGAEVAVQVLIKRKSTAPMLRLHIPITRVEKIQREGEAECRLVEGYAFVQEVVPGENGVRLKRSAMVDATPDYMKWGAIREMHQAVAVGTASAEMVTRNDGTEVELGVTWDDKGAFCRSKIVDDAAIKKLDEGVYKAYSLGVKPTLMQGKDVVACTWIENSLVDRPKDVECGLTVVRVDGKDETVDVDEQIDQFDLAELIRKKMAAPTFASYVEGRENRALRSLAISALEQCLYDCLLWDDLTAEERGAVLDLSLKEFRTYLQDKLDRGEKVIEEGSEIPTLTGTPGEIMARSDLPGQVIMSLDTLKDIQRALNENAAEIQRLNALPRRSMPVRFTEGLDKEKLQRALKADEATTEEFQDAVKRVKDMPRDTDSQRQDRVVAIQSIKAELRMKGIEIANLDEEFK